MTHLISLISEHLIPNYLLIKEMEGKWDKLVFITTKRMGEMSMTARFCNALKIDKKEVQIIIVSEDDLPDARQKLAESNFSKDDRYLVNLTGGTKIMSIAAFQHFFKYNADYFYIPIGLNKIENVRTGEDLPLDYRLNVEEYLLLYGLRFETDDTHINNKGFQFEREIFNRIKKEKNLNTDFIKQGVKIFSDIADKFNDNELDVIWTADNQLFIGECKVSLWKPKELDSENRPIQNPPEYLDEIMYKLSAISKDFGLQVHPYIFTRHKLAPPIFNATRMKSIEKRMKILGIKGLLGKEEINQSQLKI